MVDPLTPSFTAARRDMLEAFAKKGIAYDASQLPVYSVAALGFEIVDPRPVAAPTMAFAVARRGQTLSFFDYKPNDTIPNGFGGVRQATNYDTNQTEPRRVPGGRAMAVEAVSLSVVGKRIRYTGNVFPEGEAPANPAVLAAYTGEALIADPAGLMSPVQFDSPANLEELFAERLMPLLVWAAQWGQRTVKYLGALDQVPEGGAKSALRSHGEPIVSNRFILPEGWYWGGETCADSADRELVITATLTHDIVIPVTLPATIVGVEPAGAVIPERLALDVRMRLHGMQIGPAGKN